MVENKPFAKFFSRLKLGADRDPLKEEPHPEKDWQRLLAASLLLVILILAGYYFFFWQLETGQLTRPPEVPATTRPPLDPQTLEQLALEIDQRTADFNRFLENPPTTTDPAL